MIPQLVISFMNTDSATTRPWVYVSDPDPSRCEPVVSSFVGTVSFFTRSSNASLGPLRGATRFSSGEAPHYVCELGYREQTSPAGTPFIDLAVTAYEEAVSAIQQHTGAAIGYYSSDPRNAALKELRASSVLTPADAPLHQEPAVVSRQTKVEGPSLLEMASNLAGTAVKFAASGFATVTAEQHAARMAICGACEFWNPKARGGMGKCLKCGCTGAKQWVAVSVCPIGKWGAIEQHQTS